MENIRSSDYWKDHFETSAKQQRINWDQTPIISEIEKSNILGSLKAWQLGETSDGANLKKATRKYALRHNDPVYNEVINLFIKEEQKHGENLGKYIDRIGEERKKKDWGDTMFRKVRGLNTNMEIWTITVLIVESAAQIFYQALKDATECRLLKEICTDILIDEAHHIRFQKERLSIIFNRKPAWKKSIAYFIYHLHFKLTYRTIWLGHAKAFKAGGYDYSRFKSLMHHKFDAAMRYLEQSSEFKMAPIPIHNK